MRRGHPGIGGWRNENPRHFKPRGPGGPRFRLTRPYSLINAPGFPPNLPRPHRPPLHYSHPGPDDHAPLDYNDRSKYRLDNQRIQDRGQQPRPRPNYTPYHGTKQTDSSMRQGAFKNNSKFYRDTEPYHVNSLGDVDHRQQPQSSRDDREESYGQHTISPWAIPPPALKKHFMEDRSPEKSYRHHDTVDGNKMPQEYVGHRPPASDHYGTPNTLTNNNNAAFSRSVDDTVDIIRKRMLNRNDPQQTQQEADMNQDCSEHEIGEDSHEMSQPEQRTKKQPPRQRQTVKTNCDKMKTNIVQQLFKMDKDKIHKLMDNPSSSTKFEYAISSLITESQNSLNRHMRSVAEKSLSSASTNFIQNDNNTIYEDTFMKQMQCILDPQDTVLLEDIKPLVMAELSKVLQLADFEQRFEMPEDPAILPYPDEHSSFHRDPQYNYDELYHDNYYSQDEVCNYEPADQMNVPAEANPDFQYYNEPPPPLPQEDIKPLFERRPPRKTQPDHTEERKLSAEQRRISVECQRKRRSTELIANEESAVPLFETNTEQLSEDEDPFAELDRQYHVAVDHNFIENEDLSARNTPNSNQTSQRDKPLKQEIDNQLQSMAKSPLKLFTPNKVNTETNSRPTTNIKQEVVQSPDFPKENSTPHLNTDNMKRMDRAHGHIKEEPNLRLKETDKNIEKHNNPNTIKTSLYDSRKRSIDQRPSHRKEKRKKSETTQYCEPSKSSTEKVTRVNENCSETPKPSYSNNSVTPTNICKEASKDNKRTDPVDKGHTDKYVKRKKEKDTPKKLRDKEVDTSRKRHSSTSSIVSPKDNHNASKENDTASKSDSKTKLKNIDMFIEQTKKVSLHQSHRNTAPMTPKHFIPDDHKPKFPTAASRKMISTKHASTQVFKKVNTRETQTFESKTVTSRFAQTIKNRTITRSAQTEPVSFEKSKKKSTDAFERMKEIDMEIQVLLQEKFKLYSSLESKDSCSSMPTLGMTVLNVAPVEEIKDEEFDVKEEDVEEDNVINADSIIEDFTNIPVEELEQIALETVQEEKGTARGKRKTSRQRALEKISDSPTTSKRSRKEKTPNISLIEQIITDDRPLEDIISLDDFERPQSKNKKKKAPKSQPKKKSTKKSRPINLQNYNLKECSVVLIQTDLNRYFKSPDTEVLVCDTPEPLNDSPQNEVPVDDSKNNPGPSEIVVESVNDLSLDMLDVSEDIVIGDVCEIKSNEDKDVQEIMNSNLAEEIILDNSQSSVDDVLTNDMSQSECKMYDYSTDEMLKRDSITVTGNSDAVLAIECLENGFVAACLDGNVYYFNLDGQLLNTMRGSSLAVTCLTIVKEKYGTTVYTGSLDSRIRYYDLETGLEKGPECNVLSPIQTMDRAWDTVFVGTRTGFVLQFECKNNMLIPVSTVKFSEQTILALRAMKEGPRKVLLVAARSEPVTIKDAQTGLLLRTLVGPKMTVYSLMFEDGKVYCGTSSHQIHVYDYANGQHAGCHEGGKGAVCLRATGGLLFAGCYDGCVYIYRDGNTRPLAQLRGPSLMLLSLAVIGSKIIAGYKDRSVYIWKIPINILNEMIL